MSVPYFGVPLGTSLCTEKEYQDRLKKAKEAKRRQRESDRVALRPEATHCAESTSAAANENDDEMKHSEDQPRILSRASDDDNSLRPEATDNPRNEANARQNGPLANIELLSSTQQELDDTRRQVQQQQVVIERYAQQEQKQDEANARQLMEVETANYRVHQMQQKLDEELAESKMEVQGLQHELEEAKRRAHQQDEASASQRQELEDAKQRADRLEQELARAQQQVQQRQDAEQAAQRASEKQQQVDHKLFEVCTVFLHELETRTKDVEAIMRHSDEEVNSIADRRHTAILTKLKALLTSDQGASRRSDAQLLHENLESTKQEWIQTLHDISAAQKEKAELVTSAPSSDSSGSRGVEHTSPSGGSEPDVANDSDRLVHTDDEAQQSTHRPSSPAQKENETSASRGADGSPASAGGSDPDAANDSDRLIGTDDEAKQIDPDRASSYEDQERTRRMSTLKPDAAEFVPTAVTAAQRPAVDEYDNDAKYQADQPVTSFHGMQIDLQAELHHMVTQEDLEYQRKCAEAQALRSTMNPANDWRMCYAFNYEGGNACKDGPSCPWSHGYIVHERTEGGYKQPGIEQRYMDGHAYVSYDQAPWLFHDNGLQRRKQSHMQHTRSHMQYRGRY